MNSAVELQRARLNFFHVSFRFEVTHSFLVATDDIIVSATTTMLYGNIAEGHRSQEICSLATQVNY